MYGTDWPTVQSTCPPLKLYLTFEQGTRVQAQPYDLNRTRHSIRYKNSRLFHLYSSLINYYIYFLCIIVTLGRNIIDSAIRREEATCGVGGEDDDRADGSLSRLAENGIHVSVHADYWHCSGCSSATFVVHSKYTSLVLYSCGYEILSHV
jgi:hypothetical protein